ncbi:MAG: COX15/CtaA family protein [Candidatus Thiodiazotropha sp. (ex Monitilora ramsayi)]|nr:COX15/CtaA family protein [Candidatus Thiodiazotropha sp. (ex Monitilora ramsayi)]
MPVKNPQVSRHWQYRLAIFTSLLALSVVLLGAYVRLSDAGLGCPDWPGCYGKLVVPEATEAFQRDNGGYSRPLHVGKAWKEMIHRYLAGSLGIAIFALALLAWLNRKSTQQPLLLPTLLLILVIFQAALGMWTVTLQVKPAIVTAHLLGGFATFVLLWLLALRLRPVDPLHTLSTSPSLRRLVLISLFVLILQITLGGWTSTNYAALGCSEFPTCYDNQWWPEMDFKEAFVLWRGLGINYEFGVLENDARTAIHMTHRIGALVTFVVLCLLAIRLRKKTEVGRLRQIGGLLLLLLLTQIGLGITNVLGHLPLPVAVAHNGGAALLLATLVTMIWISRRHE